MWRAWRKECITLKTRLVLLDMKASTPTPDSSNICTSIALYQSNMYKQIQAKIIETFIQAYVHVYKCMYACMNYMLVAEYYLVGFMTDYSINFPTSLDWLLSELLGWLNCLLFDCGHEWLLGLHDGRLVVSTRWLSTSQLSSHSWSQSNSRQFSQPSSQPRSQSSEVVESIK